MEEDEFEPLNKLVEFASLPQGDLAVLSHDTRARDWMTRTLPFLYSDTPPITITQENFVSQVMSLRSRYKAGSQALGNLIIEASAKVDAGDKGSAVQLYRDFIASSSMPFFTKIAKSRLSELEPGRPDPLRPL